MYLYMHVSNMVQIPLPFYPLKTIKICETRMTLLHFMSEFKGNFL